MSYGVGLKRGSDPALLWLWCRPGATALTQPLACEPPYGTGSALKSKKQKKGSAFGGQGPLRMREGWPQAPVLLRPAAGPSSPRDPTTAPGAPWHWTGQPARKTSGCGPQQPFPWGSQPENPGNAGALGQGAPLPAPGPTGPSPGGAEAQGARSALQTRRSLAASAPRGRGGLFDATQTSKRTRSLISGPPILAAPLLSQPASRARSPGSLSLSSWGPSSSGPPPSFLLPLPGGDARILAPQLCVAPAPCTHPRPAHASGLSVTPPTTCSGAWEGGPGGRTRAGDREGDTGAAAHPATAHSQYRLHRFLRPPAPGRLEGEAAPSLGRQLFTLRKGTSQIKLIKL